MKNKKNLTLLLSTVFVLIVAFITIGVLILQNDDEATSDPIDNDTNTPGDVVGSDHNLTEDDFTLTTEYTGERQWTYNVSGTLPNPCYSATVSELIRESFPEQVSVQVKIDYDSESICTQQIIEFDYDGEFSADEKATVDLDVI